MSGIIQRLQNVIRWHKNGHDGIDSKSKQNRNEIPIVRIVIRLPNNRLLHLILQLTLEQQGFQFCGPTYTRIFFSNQMQIKKYSILGMQNPLVFSTGTTLELGDAQILGYMEMYYCILDY